MARPTTPAGFGSAFNRDKFREAIRATMTMGLPDNLSERVTFRWNVDRTYEIEDPEGNPYSWTEEPEDETVTEDVQIPAAVEFAARPAMSLDTTVGQFDTARATITVLDVDYPEVATADLVILGDNTYVIDFWGPPVGLFDVTVYTCYATAMDEA